MTSPPSSPVSPKIANGELFLRSLFVSLVIFCSFSAFGASVLPQPIPNWRIELIAEAPRIRHPSVVACAPDGRVFVAEDPMDISLPKADATEGRILCIHPDGGITVFAEKLYAVFGMQYLEGELYVVHAPKFSVFTDDNTDGQQWMSRVTHMVDGGFYGYPYDFIPRRPYTLWCMADYGGGAATGAFCYNEDALPPEYHGNLFLADFGKRQLLRLRLEREGATYKVVSREDFFADPPEDFRPVGIALSPEGLGI